MQIGAAQRAAQLERRDLTIIAVDGSRKILEACAAAVELSDRDRRYQYDARTRLDVEPQLVRNQRAVVCACKRQLRLGFKEVERIQLQFKRIAFFALKGIDLSLDLRKFQRKHFFGIKATFRLDAVDLKFIGFLTANRLFLQSITQFFHRKIRAVKNGFEADMPAEHQVALDVDCRPLELCRCIRNIDSNDGIVILRVNPKGKAVCIQCHA